MKVFELRQKRAGFVTEARKIADAATAETRGMTAEESGKFDGFMKQASDLEPEIRRLDTLETIEAELRSAPGRPASPLPHEVETRHGYSVMKALRQGLEAREGRGRLDGIEAETHQELEKRRGKSARGVMIPLGLDLEARAMSGASREQRALDTTAGTGTIPTILAPTMIDLLRTRTAVVGLGATVLNDMQGLFAVPRQNATGTAYWVAEGGAPTASNQTADQVAFSPKTVGAYTDYTRRFLEQTNQNAEMFVRNDLAAVIARAIDLAAINGSGSSNQPLGILQNTNIATIALGTNGLALAWANIVAMETAVAVANADMGKLAYLTNASVRGKLKGTVKDSNTAARYLWDDDGEVNGYPAAVSNQVPNNLTKGTSSGVCSAMIFGNWADLIIAYWSGLDVLVDPYTGGNAGTVRIITLQDCDINVRHPESFQKIKDILTT